MKKIGKTVVNNSCTIGSNPGISNKSFKQSAGLVSCVVRHSLGSTSRIALKTKGEHHSFRIFLAAGKNVDKRIEQTRIAVNNTKKHPQ